jgi:hypothetical protein
VFANQITQFFANGLVHRSLLDGRGFAATS